MAKNTADTKTALTSDGRPVHLMPPVIPAPVREPNVIFIGTRRVHGKEVRIEEAPAQLISGPETFSGLPTSEEQIKGFYYKRAAELCRAFPGLYKRLTKKGEK